MTSETKKLIGFTMIGFAAVMWGSNGVIVNLVPLNAYMIAFYRTLFATITLTVPIFLAKMKEFIHAIKEWKLLLMNGFMNAFG